MQEMMLSEDSRRKLSVHVTGAKEKTAQESATGSEAGTSGRSAESTATSASAEKPAAVDSATESAAGSGPANGNAAANGDVANGDVSIVGANDRVQIIKDLWAFKRSQMLYPSVK